MSTPPAPPPLEVIRVPVLVPADQAASWPKHIEAICAPHRVRSRMTSEVGRTGTLFVFELRGAAADLREVQGKLQLLIAAIALTPSRPRRGRRVVIAALSFLGGLGVVLLLFQLAAQG